VRVCEQEMCLLLYLQEELITPLLILEMSLGRTWNNNIKIISENFFQNVRIVLFVGIYPLCLPDPLFPYDEEIN
jgi:hypothetical protein